MKTKAWTPPSSLAATTGPEPLVVDRPCQMWGNGVGPIDLPLLLCMFKACELGRTATPFLIKDDAENTLLELEGGLVRGDAVIVDLFFRQASFFMHLREQLIRELQV